MATITPLTASPLRGHHLLHRRRGRLHANLQPHPQRRLSRNARLYCAPDGGGGEVSAPPAPPAAEEQAPQEKPEDFHLLAANRSDFNEMIMVIDSPAARYLVLDHNKNIHSILPKTTVWTNSYWDEFVSLPAVVPLGPVALLGLGAGTAAHLMLKFWPWLQLVGWEIDPMVRTLLIGHFFIIELSRNYFGMSDLEKPTESGGSLSVHIGDALSPSATIGGGFAGIVVDLFCDGKVIPQLQEVETWLQIAKKLMPDGRIMVNCGGADVEESLASSWVQNPTVKALCSAFPGQLNWKRLSEKESVNYVALTGPLPDLDECKGRQSPPSGAGSLDQNPRHSLAPLPIRPPQAQPARMAHSPAPSGGGGQHPLVVSLNCLDDPSLEQEGLAGVAALEHVPLSAVASGRVEAAAAVLLPSLAFLPRAAQRRLRPWQLLLCLGSADRAADAAVAADLGLRLVHVDANRAEEVADTVMALILGLLRRTHLLSRQASSGPAAVAAGWLGSVQPMCRGMRRCRGLVLGIIGRSAAARCLATRSLAFRMSVLYFDPRYAANGKPKRPSIVFPSAARRMDTLNDLLAASDLVSLHCTLTNDTMHILNADCLQHIKPGAFIVNTGSCQLIDDCALKQLLIDGTIAGCALDGAEGPQWMEAWVREMPNVLILPRSADYSEEVWMEIREKAITMLQSFFFDGVLPASAISDEDEEISEAGNEDDHLDTQAKGSQSFDAEIDESHLTLEYEKKRAISHHKEPQTSGKSVSIGSRSEGRRSRSGKKGKKRPAHRRSQQKPDDLSAVESDSNYSSRRDDETAMSSRDQVVSSSSRFASPEDSKYKQKSPAESPMEITSEKKVPILLSRKYPDKLKDGFVVALRAIDNSGYHIARQRVVGGGGWILDVVSNATNRDPAAQFLVTFKNKDTMGLRSFVAGGKLLQINRKTEFVFASHSFDVWESWMLEGSLLEGCKLINCRNPSAVLDVCIEILAAASEEDGVTRWLD
ncbi:C-terminal binding protein AN [Dichanthelium oligosanthes]|uniref:C-terminal binding protein AN n=1 Tax=Dichanthelium oligosanthes TaxID=888268 RepID=A0A1E5WJP7_9POAL|nr:C-terminal binding protein AN [Dichanthelium oligosanthes]